MMNEFNFERKVFIKKLFDSKDVLYFFNQIEFESLDVFLFCIQKNLIQVNCQSELILPFNKENKNIYQQLAKESIFFNHKNINLLAYSNDFDELFNDKTLEDLWNKNFFVTLHDFPNKDFPDLLTIKKEWIANNPIYIRSYINNKNYIEIVQKMISYFKDKNFRFYDVKFDYCSFLDMKISELTELEFWLLHLNAWSRQNHPDRIEFKKSKDLVKYIYVSDGLKLYLDNLKDDTSFIFDLGSNIEKNGEDINLVSLNNLRQYTDLTKSHLGMGNSFNYNLMNFRNNIEINGFLNEVPWITQIVSLILKI